MTVERGRREWCLLVKEKRQSPAGYSLMLFPYPEFDADRPTWVERTPYGAPISLTVSREEFDATVIGELVDVHVILNTGRVAPDGD